MYLFFVPEPIHKKEWHISSYILFELSTLCNQLVSVSFSQVNVPCLPESKYNSVQSIYILSPMVLLNINFWTVYLFKRGVTVGPVPARPSEKLFVWDFISGLSADLWSRSPSLKRLLARSLQFSTGTIFLSLSSAAVSTPLLTARRLSAGSDGTWIPPRMPTTRTRRRWWSAWTLWRKPCSGQARADSTASRAGRKARPRRSPPPPWFLTTARGR